VAEPTVCCIMLTRERPEMAWHAQQAFERRTYRPATLLVVNSGTSYKITPGTAHIWANRALAIGALRNEATRACNADILIHWDDDDWSHPNRIAEQVALLQSSGKECVGYNDLLFWSRPEAWLYHKPPLGYLPGTSLCYWRKTWECHQFPDKMRGEDEEWLRCVDSLGVSSIVDGEPRMVATIHGGNTSSRVCENSEQWKRVAEWDEYCERVI